MASKSKQYQDFNPDDMVQVSQYEKDIEEVKQRIKKLEDKFGTNEDIADTLCITAEKQVKMQEMLQKIFLALLKKDNNIKTEIESIINSTDRKAVFSFLKKVGIGVWTLIVALVSGAVVFFLKK